MPMGLARAAHTASPGGLSSSASLRRRFTSLVPALPGRQRAGRQEAGSGAPCVRALATAVSSRVSTAWPAHQLTCHGTTRLCRCPAARLCELLSACRAHRIASCATALRATQGAALAHDHRSELVATSRELRRGCVRGTDGATQNEGKQRVAAAWGSVERNASEGASLGTSAALRPQRPRRRC